MLSCSPHKPYTQVFWVTAAAQALQRLVINAQKKKKKKKSKQELLTELGTDSPLVQRASWLVDWLGRLDGWFACFSCSIVEAGRAHCLWTKRPCTTHNKKWHQRRGKKQKHCRGARERRRRGGELPGHFTQKSKEPLVTQEMFYSWSPLWIKWKCIYRLCSKRGSN